MQFVLTSQKKDNYLIYNLCGDLDYDAARKLKDAFQDSLTQGEKLFVFNMEGLKIIASYSLSTILKLSYLAKKSGASLDIICPAGNVWDVFYVLEIGKVIPLHASEEAFWNAVKSSAG